jgi:hypothetical protein
MFKNTSTGAKAPHPPVAAGLSVRVSVTVVPFSEADRTAGVAAVTAPALAVKPSAACPAGIEMLAGTATEGLLEVRMTVVATVGAEVRVTVIGTLAGPV